MNVNWSPPSLAGYVVFGAWIGFYLYWLASATGTKVTAERQSRAGEFAHRVPIWIAAALLLFHFPAFGLDRTLFPDTAAVAYISAAITLFGLAVAVWARRTLGANWSGVVTLKQGHELVQTGPYRYVRNPIYTGLLLMFAGTTVLIGQARDVVAFVLAAAALWIKIRQEEQFMSRQFPDTYPAYRRRVRALVPFLL